MTTPLSPAAAAVLTAYNETYQSDRHAIAAALRAAADHVVPFKAEDINGCWYEKRNPVREQLLAIAAELEAL